MSVSVYMFFFNSSMVGTKIKFIVKYFNSMKFENKSSEQLLIHNYSFKTDIYHIYFSVHIQSL